MIYESKVDNFGLPLMEDQKPKTRKKLKESEEDHPLDEDEIIKKAPYDMKDFIREFFEYVSEPTLENMKEFLETKGEDDGSFHEIADRNIPIYYHDIFKAYTENGRLISYANEALEDGIADTSDVSKILQAGIYVYNEEKLNEAKDWLLKHLEDYEVNDSDEEEST